MWPLLLSAAVGIGQSIFGAAAQSDAASKEQKANADQLALEKEVFQTQQTNEKPWLDAGKQALATLSTGVQNGTYDLSKYGYNDLIQDPGYQFRLSQGQNALEAAAAARGKFISGDQLKAVSDYGQQSASQEFGNAFARTEAERNATVGRLTDIASMGQSAAGATNNAAAQYVTNTGNTNANNNNAIAAGGNAIANGAAGVATAVNTGLENYMLYNLLQPQQPQTYSYGGRTF